MPCSDKERLLKEVLQNADYATFRGEVYEMSLAEFKAGRERPTQAILLAVATVALIATLIFLSFSTKTDVPSRAQGTGNSAAPVADTPNLTLVHSVQLETAEVVRSVLDRGVLLETKFAGVSAVQSVNSDPATLHEMRDAEFLALLSNDAIGFLSASNGRNLFYFAHSVRWLE